MEFSSLVSPKTVILTNSCVTNDENFAKMTFPFQWNQTVAHSKNPQQPRNVIMLTSKRSHHKTVVTYRSRRFTTCVRWVPVTIKWRHSAETTSNQGLMHQNPELLLWFYAGWILKCLDIITRKDLHSARKIAELISLLFVSDISMDAICLLVNLNLSLNWVSQKATSFSNFLLFGSYLLCFWGEIYN